MVEGLPHGHCFGLPRHFMIQSKNVRLTSCHLLVVTKTVYKKKLVRPFEIDNANLEVYIVNL